MWRSEQMVQMFYRGSFIQQDVDFSTVERALSKHMVGPEFLDSDKRYVYAEKFKKFESNEICKTVISIWQSQYGEFNTKGNLREVLKKIDDEKIVGMTDEVKQEAKDVRQSIHSCAHEINIGSNLLFRGLGREIHEVEEFTATSMSFEVALQYTVPIMIIYVPTCVVHGLVIKLGTAYDRQCEILLTNPEMEKAADTVRDEVVNYISTANLTENTGFHAEKYNLDQRRKHIQVWIYKGKKEAP